MQQEAASGRAARAELEVPRGTQGFARQQLVVRTDWEPRKRAGLRLEGLRGPLHCVPALPVPPSGLSLLWQPEGPQSQCPEAPAPRPPSPRLPRAFLLSCPSASHAPVQGPPGSP